MPWVFNRVSNFSLSSCPNPRSCRERIAESFEGNPKVVKALTDWTMKAGTIKTIPKKNLLSVADPFLHFLNANFITLNGGPMV